MKLYTLVCCCTWCTLINKYHYNYIALINITYQMCGPTLIAFIGHYINTLGVSGSS